MNILLVFIGGGLGSLCRYGLSLLWQESSFPFSTFVANVFSCILLGFFIGLASQDIFKSHHKLLFVTGFCGGFSTFSTYSGEIVLLFQEGSSIIALTYMLISVIAGILAILAGMIFSRAVFT